MDQNKLSLVLVRVRNSSRVRGSSLKVPSIQLVVVLLRGLLTPRIVMHMCLASTTTPTPEGLMAFSMASAISLVSLS
jgi:hypothetical protein